VNRDNPDEPITLAIDSTGLTTTNRGFYIEEKWKMEKRKFLKLHVLADKKTAKVAGFRVTSEHTGRFQEIPSSRKRSIEEKQCQEEALYGEGMYDARRNFNLLEELKIEPAIKKSERTPQLDRRLAFKTRRMLY
jgi:hypothetical protein